MVSNLQIASIVMHAAYNAASLQKDLALVVLAQPLSFTSLAHAICLAPTNASFVGQTCVATGWGLFDPSVRFTDYTVL